MRRRTDRIDVECPAIPPDLTLSHSEPGRIALRAGGLDLGVIQLRSGRVTFLWQDRRRFRSLFGAIDWLARSRVRVTAGRDVIATVQLAVPITVRFPLPETAAVLPDLHGVAPEHLALDGPAPGVVGWTVEASAATATLTFRNTRHPGATFDVSVDLGGTIPLARTTWRTRAGELAGRAEEAREMDTLPPAVASVRDRETDVILCTILLTPQASADDKVTR